MLRHYRFRGVDLDDFALVFDIRIYVPFVVGNRKFGFATERIVPTTIPVFASIAVASLDRPLNVKTLPDFGS